MWGQGYMRQDTQAPALLWACPPPSHSFPDSTKSPASYQRGYYTRPSLQPTKTLSFENVMFVGVLFARVSMYHVHDRGPQKPEEALDPQKLELQRAVSRRGGAENETWVL